MKIIKNRKMKGTVLLTVVSVMALMIMFMTTTLVLANAANKRAHRSYSTSQAEYTARAAIENFTEAMHRDPQIAAAVESISGIVYPDVVINGDSGSLGHLGYYDSSGDFVEDKIVVEKMPQGEYVRADVDGTGEKWEKMDILKISATARVGKEEKSVCAYIRKRPSSKTGTGTKVKGLNTAGDAKFPNGKVITGGLGVGLKDFKTSSYEMTNEMTIDTTLSFINGGLRASTSTYHIDVRTDVSESIIMGDLWVKNNSLVDIYYTPTGTYTQQNIPYLFVLGNLSADDKINIVSHGTGPAQRQPYNLFAGSMTLEGNNNTFDCDVYITDPTKSSRLFSTNGSKLEEWADSLVNSTTQHHSHGGSLYCAGNLDIGGFVINGDLRVNGDLIIDLEDAHNLEVHGDIVCGGTVTITGTGNLELRASPSAPTPKVYANSIVGGSLGPAQQDTFDNYKTLKGVNTAYPEDMTLQKILGNINPATGEVDPVADASTKIIKTLDEVRTELGYNKDEGDFKDYKGSLAGFGTGVADAANANVISDAGSGAHAVIDSTCTITGITGDFTIDTDAEPGMLVVLKGVNSYSGGAFQYWSQASGGMETITGNNFLELGNHTITVKGANGVQFFIDGKLVLDGGKIVYDGIPTSFDYTQKIPIDYYGAAMTGTTVNSAVLMRNPCLMMGSFKMPWTDLLQSVAGPTQYTYTSDTGVTYTGKPAIIGNALFHDILNTQNEFEMYYTEAGSTSGGGGFSTATGHWDIAYYSGS